MHLLLAENPRTINNAKIRRASARARTAATRLDGEAARDLTRVYQQARDEIAATIRGYAGSDGSLRLDNLQEMLQQVEARLSQLSQIRGNLLNGGLNQAATIGAMAFDSVLSSTSLTQIADEAVQWVQRFVAEDGLTLSARLWRLDRGAREAVTSAIEQAVIQGHSASQAAQDFIIKGQPIPPGVNQAINAAQADKVARITGDALMVDDGNAYAQAKRVMRTEINRAHGEAYMMTGEALDDFGGWRFLLSPSHPRPDICDLHARANIYGLGPGVYPSRERCPWPAHPNTLSYTEIVFKDEITQKDKEGKENRIGWLKKQPPHVQESVLGSRKKRAALQQGILTEREIATPWRVLKAKYEKRGIDIDALVPQSSIIFRDEDLPTIRAESVNYVLEQGHKTGFEHAVMFDTRTSTEYMRKTSRRVNQVEFDRFELVPMYDPRRSLELVHNHPSSSSLSLADLRVATLPGIESVVAAGHDGTIYRVMTQSNPDLIADVHRIGVSHAREYILPLLRDRALNQYQSEVLFSHFVNRVIHKTDLIDYIVENLVGTLADALNSIDDHAFNDAIESAAQEAIDSYL